MTFHIFEKHPALDAYRYGPSYTPYAIIAVDKRFSDAELAAEFWRARSNDHANVFHRFATANHFDE